MIAGMTTKIAVSLPDDQVAAARRAVREGRAASVSAYVSAALSAHQDREGLRVLLDDLDHEFGPVPEGVAAWAKQAADGTNAVFGEPPPAAPQ